MTKLERGLKILDGWDITVSKSGNRRCYLDRHMGRGYWLTRADVEYAVDCAPLADAYSHWCDGTGRQMSERATRRVFGYPRD